MNDCIMLRHNLPCFPLFIRTHISSCFLLCCRWSEYQSRSFQLPFLLLPILSILFFATSFCSIRLMVACETPRDSARSEYVEEGFVRNASNNSFSFSWVRRRLRATRPDYVEPKTNLEWATFHVINTIAYGQHWGLMSNEMREAQTFSEDPVAYLRRWSVRSFFNA